MSKEKRAVANNEEVGQLRYDTYRKSISRIKSSIDAGYYLEAITLTESLIADRLESRLNHLTKSSDFSFRTLGALQKGIRNNESNNDLIALVEKEKGKLDKWRESRNKALHRMAKIEEGDDSNWEDKMKLCKDIAEKGEELRKEIFKLTDRRN